MHDSVLICIGLGTSILRVRERPGQAGRRRFGPPRLELDTRLCDFSLVLLIGFSGAGCFLQSALNLIGCVIARRQRFVKLRLRIRIAPVLHASFLPPHLPRPVVVEQSFA